MIEALWVFEIPMALPLDARAARSSASTRRARRCGAPRRWGRSTRASRSRPRPSAPATRRGDRRGGPPARRRGDRAGRRGADAACAAERCWAAGAGRSRTSSGEVTKYVVKKAPCRVILTAPPATPPGEPAARGQPAVRRSGDGSAAVVAGKRLGPTMFVLIVGAGRVGSAVAKAALAAGHEVSVLDEDPLSHERLDKDQRDSWEDAGGQFTVGTALEIDALIEAGIERADVFIAATNGDNTNLVIAQIAQQALQRARRVIVRVLDPYRAAVVRGAGPAHRSARPSYAIEMLEEAVLGPRPSTGAALMYVVIVGAGKVGWNLARELHRQGPRGHADRVRPAPLPGRRAGARARRPVRRRHRAVGARARRHPARRPGDRGHRRRRGQHPHLPDGEGEVPVRADHRPRQQPAEPPALQAARHPARGLGDRPDPAPDRARGAQVRARPPARPRRGPPRDHRARGRRGRPRRGPRGARHRAARRAA